MNLSKVSWKLLLTFICLFLLFTRLYKINVVPPSLYWDEASIGYNAYSIAETGRDEWGEVSPLHFRAFGEFKLPLYIYSTAVSVKLFGLNEFSVRLPAVLFSLGVVLLTFLLSRRLYRSNAIALLSALFVAISPWLFIFSRTGYEVTGGLMFYLLGIFLFLQKPSGKFLLFSTTSFILSAYSYNSFRIISPLTLLVLVIFSLRDVKAYFKKGLVYLIIAFLLTLLSFVPIYRLYTQDAGIFRLSVVRAPVSSYVSNYLSHFSPDFLFFRGDGNMRSQQGGFGELLLPDILFLPLGLFFIFKSKSKTYLLPLILLLFSPIPAALTKESPHALRSLSVVPFVSMISGAGVIFLSSFLRKKTVVLLVTVIYLAFFINYFLSFLNTYPVLSSKDWQYGYKKVFTGFKSNFQQYEKIFIADEYAQPYIFALFYLQFDPQRFLKTAERNDPSNWGFSTVAAFDKFEFGKVKDLRQEDKAVLIFSEKEENIQGLDFIGKINFLDSRTAFWLYETTK